MFFFFTSPITKQIRAFIAWKSLRYPSVIGTYEYVLKDFCKMSRMKDAAVISAASIEQFIESRNGEFARIQAKRVLRQFLTYWCKMGLLSRDFDSLMSTDMIAPMLVSPKMNVRNVIRVQNLRKEMVNGKPMSFEKIRLRLESEDHRRYDIAQIYRWYKYKIPDQSLSPSSPLTVIKTSRTLPSRQ